MSFGSKFDGAISWGQKPLIGNISRAMSIEGIIGIAVSLLVVVSIVPTALVMMSNGTGVFTHPASASWTYNSAVLMMFQVLLPIVVLVTLGLILYKKTHG